MSAIQQICGMSLWSTSSGVWWISQWTKQKGHNTESKSRDACWSNCTSLRFYGFWWLKWRFSFKQGGWAMVHYSAEWSPKVPWISHRACQDRCRSTNCTDRKWDVVSNSVHTGEMGKTVPLDVDSAEVYAPIWQPGRWWYRWWRVKSSTMLKCSRTYQKLK